MRNLTKAILLLIGLLGIQSYNAFASDEDRQTETLLFKQLRPCVTSSVNPLIPHSMFTRWKSTEIQINKNNLAEAYSAEMNAMHNLNTAISHRLDIGLAAQLTVMFTTGAVLSFTRIGSHLWRAFSKILPNKITARHNASFLSGLCLASAIGGCAAIATNKRIISGDWSALYSHRNFLVQTIRTLKVNSVGDQIITRLEDERATAPWKKDRYVNIALSWLKKAVKA